MRFFWATSGNRQASHLRVNDHLDGVQVTRMAICFGRPHPQVLALAISHAFNRMLHGWRRHDEFTSSISHAASGWQVSTWRQRRKQALKRRYVAKPDELLVKRGGVLKTQISQIFDGGFIDFTRYLDSPDADGGQEKPVERLMEVACGRPTQRTVGTRCFTVISSDHVRKGRWTYARVG